MRQPRDYDAELKALADKAKQLKAKRVRQLGELVIACGADALPVEILAGSLLAAADTRDATVKEGWRKRGAAFFSTSAPQPRHSAVGKPGRVAPNDSGAQPAAAGPGTA